MADEFEATTGVRRGRSFGWSPMENMTGMRRRSTFDYDHDDEDDDHPSPPSVICDNNNDNSMLFLDFHDKPHQYPLQDISVTSSSCSTYDWNNNQVLIDTGNERSESNYNSVEQEDVTNYRHTDWSSATRNYPLIGAKKEEDGIEDYSSTMAKCAQGLLPTTITNFPMSNSLSSAYSYHSSYVHSLFEHDHDLEPQQPQQSFYNNYQFSPSSSKLSPNFTKSLTSKLLTSNNLHTSNNLPFWTGVVDASSFHPQIINPTYEDKPANCNKPMIRSSNNEPTFKRPRIETPSPLPTFKVRKEKLGDRITALQQLVSPFGKTDTASVLHEAIEYIKFLHDQVGVLSSPYMKSASQNIRTQQISRKLKDSEGDKQDLRTRGLCLVPISSTYPVANETASDFWTPTFGGTFR